MNCFPIKTLHRSAAVFFLLVGCAALGSEDRTADKDDEYLAMRRMIGRGEYAAARSRALDLMDKYPGFAYAYESYVEVSQYIHALDSAEIVMHRRIAAGTDVPYSLYALGLVQYGKAHYKDCYDSFLQAIRYGVKTPGCYKNLAYCMEKVFGADEATRRLSLYCAKNPESAMWWYTLGLAYWGKGDLVEARNSFQEAMKRFPAEQACKQAWVAVNVLWGERLGIQSELEHLVKAALNSGDLQGSEFLRSYLLMLEFQNVDLARWKADAKEVESEASEYGLIRWLGWSYLRTAEELNREGEYLRAVAYLQKADDAVRIANDEALLSGISKARFQAFFHSGCLDGARAVIVDEVSAARQGHGSIDSINVLLRCALLFHVQGHDKTAWSIMAEVFARLKEQKGLSANSMMAHFSFGLIEESRGLHWNAYEDFQEARKCLPHGWTAKMNDAAIWSEAIRSEVLGGKKGARVEEELVQRERLAAKANSLSEEMSIAENRGLYLMNIGQSDNAILYFRRAITLARELNARLTLTDVLPAYIHSLKQESRNNELFEARKLFAETVDSIKKGDCALEGLSPLDSAAIKCCLENSLYCVNGNDALAGLRWSERALGYVERTNRWYAQVLGSVQNEGQPGINDLGNMRRIINAAHMFTPDPLEPVSTSSLANLDAVMLEDSLWRLSQRTGYCNEKCKTLDDLILAKARERCADDCAIVEFAATERALLVFVCNADTVVVKTTPVDRAKLDELIVSVSCDGEMGALPKQNEFDRYRLASLLFDSVKTWIEPKQNWLIIPGACLRNVPFEGLILPHLKGGPPQFLVESHNVVYETSLVAACSRPSTQPARTGRIVLGGIPDLSGSAQANASLRMLDIQDKEAGVRFEGITEELSLLHNTLGVQRDVTVFQGMKKSEFLTALQSADIVHLASHSRGKGVRMPAIEFGRDSTGQGEADELCFPWELLGSRPSASIVVMSGCNTAAGACVPLDGSIAVALRLAGVPCVVGTMGRVGDRASARFMELFYRYLSKGRTVAAALRDTKCELIHAGADQSEWLPYVVYGLGERTGLPPQKGWWSAEIWIIGVVFLVVGAVSVVVWRARLKSAMPTATPE